jgi:hypothetical protein
MPFDLKAAREAGVSDDITAKELARMSGFPYEKAIASGVTASVLAEQLAQSYGGANTSVVPPQPAAPQQEDAGAWAAAGSGAKATFGGMGNMIGLTSDDDLRRYKEEEAAAQQNHPIATMAGKLGAILPTFAVGASGGVAATGVMAATKLLPMGIRAIVGSLPASAAVAGGQRSETIQEKQLQGATLEEATNAANAGFPIDAAMMALPGGIGKTLGRGIATGVGMNVAGGVASRAAQNQFLPESAQYEATDPTAMGLEAGMGVVAGAFGRVPVKAFKRGSDAAPNAGKTADDLIKAAVKQEEVQIGRNTEYLAKKEAELAEWIGPPDRTISKEGMEGFTAKKEALEGEIDSIKLAIKTSEELIARVAEGTDSPTAPAKPVLEPAVVEQDKGREQSAICC